METGVVTTSRRYNELKLKADRKAVELQSLLDTLTMIKLEHDALERMKMRQTPESDRIGTLTRGIEEATEEIEGKLHYRRVLHYMLQRLENNKVSYVDIWRALLTRILCSIVEDVESFFPRRDGCTLRFVA